MRRPLKCSVPMDYAIFSKCVQVRASQAVRSRESLGRWPDLVSGTVGFFLERRVSLLLITMLVAAVGVNRTLLRRILGGWAFALACRREAFTSLDVSYTTAATLPPSRWCRVNGALLDELALVTGPKSTCESKTFMESKNLSATVSKTFKTQVCVQ